MTFCAWLLSSSIFLIFIHTLSCISTTLIFIYELASHCMYILQFVYPLIHWWIFVGFFLPLAFVSSAAMNIGTYVFVWVIVFNSLRCISSRILGYMVILCLTFWGNISLPNSFFFFLLIYLTFLVFFSFLPGNTGCYVFPAPLNLKNSFITSKVPLQHLFTISVYLKMPCVQLILTDSFSGYRTSG